MKRNQGGFVLALAVLFLFTGLSMKITMLKQWDWVYEKSTD